MMDKFTRIMNEMSAGIRKLSYFDLGQEYGNLRNSHDDLLAALQGIIANRDKNAPTPEKFVTGGMVDYWSPAASMIDSEFIANARAAVAKALGTP